MPNQASLLLKCPCLTSEILPRSGDPNVYQFASAQLDKICKHAAAGLRWRNPRSVLTVVLGPWAWYSA